MVLLHGNALRVPHFKPCEQDIQGGLVFLIFFRTSAADSISITMAKFCSSGGASCLRYRTRACKARFRISARRVAALRSGRGGRLDEGFDQAQHVLIVPHISFNGL